MNSSQKSRTVKVLVVVLGLLTLSVARPPAAQAQSSWKLLDLQLAATHQYGTYTRAIAQDSAPFGFAAWTKKGQRWRSRYVTRPLDVARAAREQLGPNALAFELADGSGVLALNPTAAPQLVVPVVIVASDLAGDRDGVRRGGTNYQTVTNTVQHWYDQQLGSTFSQLPPIRIPSTVTAAAWNDLSTHDGSGRLDYFDAGVRALSDAGLEKLSSGWDKLASVYSGASESVWMGAAGDRDGRRVVVPPRATSVYCDPLQGPLSASCSDAAYALGHEFGHNLNLGHSCEDYPQEPACQNSIMQTGHPMDAQLLPEEKQRLQNNPFLSYASGQ